MSLILDIKSLLLPAFRAKTPPCAYTTSIMEHIAAALALRHESDAGLHLRGQPLVCGCRSAGAVLGCVTRRETSEVRTSDYAKKP